TVPSGYGPLGPNQIANPTLIQVTGLNNTSITPYVVKPPVPSANLAGAVTITNPGFPFGSVAGQIVAGVNGGPPTCATNAQLSALPNSPLGPVCAWSIWVDATALNATNTTRIAACGPDAVNSALSNFGVAGTLTFNP